MNPDSHSSDHTASSPKKVIELQSDVGATNPPKAEDAIHRFRTLLAELIARQLVAERRTLPDSNGVVQG